MRLSQYIERQPERRKASRRKSDARATIVTHSSFVPMVTAWGAALFGLSVVVLPAAAIERIVMVTGMGLGETTTRYVFAGIASLLGAALAFVISGAVQASAIRRAGDNALVSAVHSRRSRPIDPATELGSESLDAPFEKMPFADQPVEEDAFEEVVEEAEAEAEPEPALLLEKPRKPRESQPTLGELSKRGYEFEAPDEPAHAKGKAKKSEWAFTHKQFQSALIESCEGATCEAEGEARSTRAPEPAAKPEAAASLPERPEQLDLGEFAELPGRNAVWVDVPAGENRVRKTHEPRPEVPSASALELLRQTPPEQLSLVEMVERFAAALHERQATDQVRTASGGPTRDAALAEALKALTFFTSQGMEQNSGPSANAPKPQSDDPRIAATERELREALAKLQDLRGAA